MQRTHDIRRMFAQLLRTKNFAANGTLELLGESFIADEATIFGEVNEEYLKRELDWYYTQKCNVNNIAAPIPEIWKQVSGRKGEVNSNYGYLIFSDENQNQYNNVLTTLLTQPNGRQGTMIYTRPTMYNDSTLHGMHDFICTNAVNYFVRAGRVNAVVQMRSNDVVFGYKNDRAWQMHILTKLTYDLQRAGRAVEVGDLIWNAASLHVYERHFDLVKDGA